MLTPKIKHWNWFVRIITLNWPDAITLAPFGVYIKDEHFNDEVIRGHEKIHWRQQMEMLIIPFYLWYFIEWLVKLFIYGKKAYLNISFEREAFYYEPCADDYLEVREPFVWINYL
jgi:hypothetical protein